MTLAKPRSKLFDTGPQGQLPRKLGNRQGKWREELTKAVFCCGRGLQNAFSPEETLPGPKTLEDIAGLQDIYSGASPSVRSRPCGLLRHTAPRTVHARAVEEPVARQSPTCSGTRPHRTPQQHREAHEVLLHPGSSSWCPWTPQVARNW